MAFPIIPVLMGVGTAVSTYGTIQQGKAAKEQADAQARINFEQAKAVEREGAEREAILRQQSQKVVGSMVANRGASGVTLEGSPMDYIMESVANAERDALSIRFSAQDQARMIRMGGQLRMDAGRAALTSSYLSATGQALQGIGMTSNMLGRRDS